MMVDFVSLSHALDFHTGIQRRYKAERNLTLFEH